MAGDGPSLNEMKLLANKLGIENKIVFLGKVQNVDELFS
jgi:glycosyltransferase involved in cell wall biosynthesis